MTTKASPARLVPAAVLISATVLGLTGSTGVLMPAVADHHAVRSGVAAVLVVSATAVQFALCPLADRLGDALGARRTVVAAGVAGAIGFAALAWVPAVWLAVPVYAAGVGSCAAGATLPLLSRLTRLHGRRARTAVALFTAAAQAGSAALAPAWGTGVHAWGLRPACTVAAGVVLTVAPLGAWLLPSSPRCPAGRPGAAPPARSAGPGCDGSSSATSCAAPRPTSPRRCCPSRPSGRD
jgi:MFS family permease